MMVIIIIPNYTSVISGRNALVEIVFSDGMLIRNERSNSGTLMYAAK